MEAGIVSEVTEAPPAIVFVDLVSYTTLTEVEGDEVAAAHAVRLADLVQASAAAWNGRAVKLLGDGALLHFMDATSAARCCLDLVLRLPEEGLTAVHAGIDAGPVVIRDGDCFGRTVNLAARVCGEARGDEVLATDAVRVAAEGWTCPSRRWASAP
jgi:adenylate cyclase